MISKKRLRERLIDISASNLKWLDEDGYWGDFSAEELSNFLEGVTRAFHLNRDSYLTHFNNLNSYDDMDLVVELFYNGQDQFNQA